MGELFVNSGISQGTLFLLPPPPFTVGRTPENQVQIADPWVSSTHARFEVRGEEMWIVDLGSSNGTFLNEARIREARLTGRARLRFGKTAAEFRATPTKTAGPQPIPAASGTIFRSISSLQAEGAQAAETRGRQIAVLNEMGKALVDAPTLDDALTKILYAIASSVRAERSCLLLMDDQGNMVPRVYSPPGSSQEISSTLLAAAKTHRGGLVTVDAQADLRLAQSRSILAQGVRSCLCSPIWAEGRILGMLVLDRSIVQPFSAEDLELVTTVGYQAALAIERSRVMERAQRMEEQRKKLLRHFSPDVANMILSSDASDQDPMQVSLREGVTVLFSDVRGFTGLTERLPPLELGQLLKEYFREMTEAVFAERGTLDKFIGDGLMAVFGAPVPQADGAARAVKAALRMLDRLRDLNSRLPEDRQIQIRVGVNTGRVIAGNFGSPDRMEFTVLGDTVNVASRLESIASPNTVFVGRGTYEATRNEFEYEVLGARQVKGRTAQVEAFRVVGFRGR